MDLGETVPSLCSETGLTVTAGGSEVSNIRVEEVLRIQKEEDHLALALPAVKGVDKVQMASGLLSKRRREEVSSEPAVMVGEPRSINDLPDEILLKIISYFGTEDLCLIFADVCERWNTLSKQLIVWKKMSYSCDSTSDISRVLQVLTVAPALQSLIIREREDVLRILETLSVSRVGLTKLILKKCKFDMDGSRILNNIVTLCPDLESLLLEYCGPLRSADYCLISQLKKLSELKLSFCEGSPRERILFIVNSCQNLKKLDLDEVYYLYDDDIINIINKLGKQLTALVLRGNRLTDIAYLYLKNCARLQELEVNDCEGMTDRGFLEGIGSLQELTSFRLIDANEVTAETFSTFLHRPSVASMVSLLLACDSLDDEGVEGIAERCINLKELEIGIIINDPYSCMSVSDYGISMVIRHCNQLRILNLICLEYLKDEELSVEVPAYLPNLRVLSLEACRFVRDHTIDIIRAPLPELAILDLDRRIVGGMKKELSDKYGNLNFYGYEILREWALGR